MPMPALLQGPPGQVGADLWQVAPEQGLGGKQLKFGMARISLLDTPNPPIEEIGLGIGEESRTFEKYGP